jgi:hypothetical protein
MNLSKTKLKLILCVAAVCLSTFVRADTIEYLDNGIIKVGVNLSKGGAITEISHQGFNLVDNNDTGRYVQVGLYDSTGVEGWNPVQGGNWNDAESGYLAFHTGSYEWGGEIFDYIASTAQPLHWNPAEGISDVYLHQKVSLARSVPVIRVQWQVDNFGNSNQNVSWRQEFPAVFVVTPLQHLYSSGTSTPWVGGPVQYHPNVPVKVFTDPVGSHLHYYSNEYWSHWAIDTGNKFGLTLFAEDDGPFGPVNNFYATKASNDISQPNYMAPNHWDNIDAGINAGVGAWLVVGNLADNRNLIYQLHNLINQ